MVTLREYVMKHYGKKGFRGRAIKTSVLRELAKKKGKIGERARLALIRRRIKRLVRR